MKNIFLIALIITTSLSFAQSSYNYQEVIGNAKKAIDLSGKFAMFPEGEKGLKSYFLHSVRYPSEAVQANIEERITMSYAISKKGKVKSIKVIKGQNRVLVKESKRVLKSMTGWRPGSFHGKSIRTFYEQDFNFLLI